MITHPVHVGRKSYRGGDVRKREKISRYNQQAAALEACVNAMLLEQTLPVETYLWMEIANRSGLPYDAVQEMGYSIDGGSNGFTAWRHDLTYEQAMAEISRSRD